MITKNTKIVKIFMALIKAAWAEHMAVNDVVRDLGPDADLHMADYQVLDLRFTREGCYGNTLNLFGQVSYARYENGDESVHWSVSAEGQKFYCKFNMTDVEEYQKAVKACCDKLTRAAAKGAHQKIAEYHPFPANTASDIGVYSDTEGALRWYVSCDMCDLERAEKAEEDV